VAGSAPRAEGFGVAWIEADAEELPFDDVPPDTPQPSPQERGVEEVVRERLGRLAARLDLHRKALSWDADSPEALATEVGESAPTWVAAWQALPPERYEAMSGELLELVRRPGGDGPVRIDDDYLVIVARRRG
jgi:hypothetical protein